MEEAIKKAYRRGYEDGYDQGCMDLLDTDLGEDTIETDTQNGDEYPQITWDEYETHEGRGKP